MFCKTKSAKKIFFLRSDFWQFSNKNVQIWDDFFPLLFPNDSESLKILDIGLWEVGAKRRLNGTLKVNTHKDGQTDTQTDISTYRKPWPRGPMLWKEFWFWVIIHNIDNTLTYERKHYSKVSMKIVLILLKGRYLVREMPYPCLWSASYHLIWASPGLTWHSSWEPLSRGPSTCGRPLCRRGQPGPSNQLLHYKTKTAVLISVIVYLFWNHKIF